MESNNTIAKQLSIAQELYGKDKDYSRLKDTYELFHTMNLCTKHHTYDSTFFIIDEGSAGFKIIKFYDGGIDYRVSPGFESLAVAYSMALCAL